MPSSGPTSGNAFANDTSFGDPAYPWSDPSNAGASDDARATSAPDGGATTVYLKVYFPAANIPTGSTIDGIEYAIERSKGNSRAVKDERVRAVKAGVIQSVDKADTATDWTQTDTVITYGSPIDNWGGGWVAADFDDAAQGVVIAVKATSGFIAQPRIDHITRTVYYTEPIVTQVGFLSFLGFLFGVTGVVAAAGQSGPLIGLWTNVIALQAAPPRHELQTTNERKTLKAGERCKP